MYWEYCDRALRRLSSSSCEEGDDWLEGVNIRAAIEAWEKCPRADWLAWAIVDGFGVPNQSYTGIQDFLLTKFGIEPAGSHAYMALHYAGRVCDPIIVEGIRNKYRDAVAARINELNNKMAT